MNKTLATMLAIAAPYLGASFYHYVLPHNDLFWLATISGVIAAWISIFSWVK